MSATCKDCLDNRLDWFPCEVSRSFNKYPCVTYTHCRKFHSILTQALGTQLKLPFSITLAALARCDVEHALRCTLISKTCF